MSRDITAIWDVTSFRAVDRKTQRSAGEFRASDTRRCSFGWVVTTFRGNVMLSFEVVKWTKKAKRSFETSGVYHTTKQCRVSEHFTTASFFRVANLKQLSGLRGNIWIRSFHNSKQMCHPLHPAVRATVQSDVPSSPPCCPCHSSVWCAILSIPKGRVTVQSNVPFSLSPKAVPQFSLMCHSLYPQRPCHSSV